MHIIAGKYKNHILTAPKSTLTRPTSSRLRETLFNICQGIIEDAIFLDLFSGSGAIGLEALSRGAQKSIFIDHSKESFSCIFKNIEKLQLKDATTVICNDVFATLKKFINAGLQFDLIYADPPYDQKGSFEGHTRSYSHQLLLIFDEFPLLKEDGLLFIEDLSAEPIKELELKTLQLISSRRAGKAHLCEYKKVLCKSNKEG